MPELLNDVEVRVLGCLVEKEITTPEYYPLTLNSLATACNQKSNRNPVVSYDEATVAQAVDSLRAKDIAIVEKGRDARVPKYDNYFADHYHLSHAEVAVLCELMLRGPQTVGEIRTRGERLYQFAGLEEVADVLDALAAREESPLVVKLPRQTGQKECRYAHLLSGEEGITAPTDRDAVDGVDAARLEQLEEEVTSLRAELSELRRQFDDFRTQFE
ncbi:MAG: YceH family protein [Armatimonadota bacterium]